VTPELRNVGSLLVGLTDDLRQVETVDGLKQALVIAAVIPGPLSFVAKEELARQWVAGPFLRRIGTLFVRRIDPKGRRGGRSTSWRPRAPGARLLPGAR
jgi:hypothetical protein